MNELELIKGAARKALDPVFRLVDWTVSNPVETLLIALAWVVLFLIAG